MTNRLHMYRDLVPILDEALASGGGTMTFATQSDAIAWRHRVYRFRKEYGKVFGPNKYDALTLRRVTEEGTVEILTQRAEGLFTPAQPTIDPLEAEAQALRRKLFGD